MFPTSIENMIDEAQNLYLSTTALFDPDVRQTSYTARITIQIIFEY